MEFGKALRLMRKGAGMSQEDMAESMHIARSSISKLERDQLELRASDLIRWCRVTDNPDVLMAIYAGIDVTATLIASGATSTIIGTISILLGGFI